MPLSKSRFTAGWQCPRLLWWKTHEPDAPELHVDEVLQDRFDQGAQVGLLAHAEFPGGVLIDLPHRHPDREPATRAAIDAGAPAIFEATFVTHDVYVQVDVLLRLPDGWAVIEVKSSSETKPEHIPDAAIQAWVVAGAGLNVRRVEIMHLSKDYRHRQAGALFERTDVTADVIGFLPQVTGMVQEFHAVLAGPLPDVTVGEQCGRPRDCNFLDRCWPDDRDHIRHLYRIGFRGARSYMQQGIHRIPDLPQGARLNATQQRQVRSVVEDRVIVEPTLAEALAVLDVDRVGHLDFETIQRAVPVWDGQKPWEQTAVQFSYHEVQPDGTMPHQEYLAEGPEDPRTEIADRLIAATERADAIVTYSSFEKQRIEQLARQVPDRAAELLAITERLVDLLPIVRNHVYHPAFQGSFSLKEVLPSLCPDLTYDDLVIVDGMRASVELARLLFFEHLVEDYEGTRHNLLAYCKRDTEATVRVVEELRRLAP